MTVKVSETIRRHEIGMIREHLSVLGLPDGSANSLSEVARLRARNRGSTFMVGPTKMSYLLITGRVAELFSPLSQERLWRDAMFFEDVSSMPFPGTYSDEGMATSRFNPSYMVCLTSCRLIEFPSSRLHELAMGDPAIALFLARMANKRHALTEQLYGATRATPVSRVAAVLEYLAEPRRFNQVKHRKTDGKAVMTVAEEVVASGPSQTDIADSLSLGRATVEKAIAELRKVGALKAFGPGERTNCTYPVADQGLLMQIALGG
ncbi:hypothetical protein GCM10010304_81990 [Streptomyces roseoviolaceus]